MNRRSASIPQPFDLVPVDPTRRALEQRIEHAKGRIVEDLDRAGRLVREVAHRAGRGAFALALIAGIAVAGAIVFAVVRLRGRGIRITWR